MSGLTRTAFSAALARQGITPPPKDFEAALRTARFLEESARKVAAHVGALEDDASR